MGQASINNSWSFLALTVVFLLTQVAYVGAAPSRRGDLNFPETIFDLPSPQYLSESIFLEQHDEPSRCNNFTIGEASSCPNPLLTTLYGKPYSNFDPPFSNKKMWFARRLNKGIYVAGQLSRRQIRYAADSGFKSIATIFDHEGTGENNVTFELTTDEEEALVKQAGMKFFRILKPTDDWTKIIAIERMRDVYPKVELPALFHCERGVAVTLHILLYYAQGYQRSSRAVPKIDNERFYELTNRHGLDFVDLFAPFTEALVEEVFGEPMPPSATKPSVSAPMWFDYWQTHPVRGNWFMAGQITSSDIPVIKSTGVLTILNIRQGLLNNGDLSQENAELINIKSSATFDSSGNPIRQRKETLETLVIDKTRPTQYVSQDSLVNYEKVNIDEFGDHIGYNERREQDAVREAGLDYTHLPLQENLDGFDTYIRENLNQLLEVGKKGPVLIHCDSGKRSALVSVFVAAVQYDLSLDWALQRLKEIGYGISAQSHPQIYRVYQEHLAYNQRVESQLSLFSKIRVQITKFYSIMYGLV